MHRQHLIFVNISLFPSCMDHLWSCTQIQMLSLTPYIPLHPCLLHWKEQVEKDIRRDVALGVLEEVPENTPVTWCHRLVVCRKHNGDPRRTVDLQKLNEASIRQCHPTEPPLQQAMTVPHHMKKTTLDAWNGYHSVAIKEEDRHKTTFITEWGRFRYKTLP